MPPPHPGATRLRERQLPTGASKRRRKRELSQLLAPEERLYSSGETPGITFCNRMPSNIPTLAYRGAGLRKSGKSSADCLLLTNPHMPAGIERGMYTTIRPPFKTIRWPTCISWSSNTLFAVLEQAHYACARESTVFELGLLPAEVLATQGNPLKCSLGVSVSTKLHRYSSRFNWQWCHQRCRVAV